MDCSISSETTPNTPDFDITTKQQTWEFFKLVVFFFFPPPLSEGRFEDILSSIAFSTQIHQDYHFEGENVSYIPVFLLLSPPQSLQPHQKPSVSGEDKDSKSPVLGRKHPLCGKELLS